MEEIKENNLKEEVENSKKGLREAYVKIANLPPGILENVKEWVEAKRALKKAEVAYEAYISHCTVCGEWINEMDVCGCEWCN